MRLRFSNLAHYAWRLSVEGQFSSEGHYRRTKISETGVFSSSIFNKQLDNIAIYTAAGPIYVYSLKFLSFLSLKPFQEFFSIFKIGTQPNQTAQK